MSYKASILAFIIWNFRLKGSNTRRRGEVSTSGWRPWLKNVCAFISIISELSKEFPAIWLVQGLHFGGPASKLATFAISASKHGGLLHVEWIFHQFGRHHSKFGIFERMKNFQNDCCHPWTKHFSQNSCSRQFRIVNAVVTLIASRLIRSIWINWPKSVFLQTKATHFETMMTTVDEVNSDKTKVPGEFIFRSVLLDSDCFTAVLDVNWFTVGVRERSLTFRGGRVGIISKVRAQKF